MGWDGDYDHTHAVEASQAIPTTVRWNRCFYSILMTVAATSVNLLQTNLAMENPLCIDGFQGFH